MKPYAPPHSGPRALPTTSQEGMALVTVMLLLLVVTVVGISSLTVTGMENRMAGFTRSGESAGTVAEACVDTGMQVIQQTLDISSGGSLPFAFDVGNGGPVPDANHGTLNAELLGQDDNKDDIPTGVPNLVMTLNNFTVRGDIDRLYVQPKPGASQAFDAPQSGSTEIIYRIDCLSVNAATGASSRISGVFACTLASDGCQRAL